MTDLTKIATPFGLLDPETQEALRTWEHGVEIYKGDGNWYESNPYWNCANTYRARPAPLVPDSIDWSHVAPEWKWMARDEDGLVYFYTGKPNMGAYNWDSISEWEYCTAFASYRRGTVAWGDSLVQRPEGV